MKYHIYYEGLAGTIDFSKYPYIYDTHDLFDYEYGSITTELPAQNRTTLDQLYCSGKMKTLTVQIVGKQKAQCLNDLEYKLNYDIVAKKPGKLYVNDEYLNCYLISSTKKEWNQYKDFEYITLTLFCESPKWIYEQLYEFSVYEQSKVKNGFKFPAYFPFSWKYNRNSRKIVNEHYTDVKCELIFFGPISNPKIKIGNYSYEIQDEILANERFEINQLNKTIVKITETGETVNVFHKRNKEHNVFEPIRKGENLIETTETFAFSVRLYTERNEPQWK